MSCLAFFLTLARFAWSRGCPCHKRDPHARAYAMILRVLREPFDADGARTTELSPGARSDRSGGASSHLHPHIRKCARCSVQALRPPWYPVLLTPRRSPRLCYTFHSRRPLQSASSPDHAREAPDPRRRGIQQAIHPHPDIKPSLPSLLRRSCAPCTQRSAPARHAHAGTPAQDPWGPTRPPAPADPWAARSLAHPRAPPCAPASSLGGASTCARGPAGVQASLISPRRSQRHLP